MGDPHMRFALEILPLQLTSAVLKSLAPYIGMNTPVDLEGFSKPNDKLRTAVVSRLVSQRLIGPGLGARPLIELLERNGVPPDLERVVSVCKNYDWDAGEVLVKAGNLSSRAPFLFADSYAPSLFLSSCAQPSRARAASGPRRTREIAVE